MTTKEDIIRRLCYTYLKASFGTLTTDLDHTNLLFDVKRAPEILSHYENQIYDFFYNANRPTEELLEPRILMIFYKFNEEFRKKIDAGYTKDVLENLEIKLFKEGGIVFPEDTINTLLSIKNIGTREKIMELSSIANQKKGDVYKIPFQIAKVYKDHLLSVKWKEKGTYKYKNIDSNFAKSFSYLKLKLKKMEKVDEYMKNKVASLIRQIALNYPSELSPLFFEESCIKNMKDFFRKYLGALKDYDKTMTIKEKFDNAIEKLNTKIEEEKEKKKKLEKKAEKEKAQIIAQLSKNLKNK